MDAVAEIGLRLAPVVSLGSPVAVVGIVGVVAEGADGECAYAPARIVCPASHAVTFRWSVDDGRSLRTLEGGSFVVEPGQTRVGLVVTDAQFAELQGALEGVSADDPAVRVEAVEVLHQWSWRQSNGPIGPSAPVPFAEGLVAAIAKDPAPTVRRAAVPLARDLRDDRRAFEVESALLGLSRDPDLKTRKLALAALAPATKDGMVVAAHAWDRCIDAVTLSGGDGRAAAATLAKLHGAEGLGEVDPALAVARTLEAHPESTWKVWSAWRREVPFRAEWADRLLGTTDNLDRRLVNYWATSQPGEFAAAVRRWEPAGPHSKRFTVLATYLEDATDPELRDALDLGPLEAPKKRQK